MVYPITHSRLFSYAVTWVTAGRWNRAVLKLTTDLLKDNEEGRSLI